MSIATFRLAREQEELKAQAAVEEAPVNCPMPTPKPQEEAPAPAPKAKTTTAKA